MNCLIEAAHCAEAARPWAQMTIVILGGRLVWLIGSALNATRQKRWPLAWRSSLKLLGWRSMLTTVGVIAVLLILNRLPDMFSEVSVLQTSHLAASLIPLTAGGVRGLRTSRAVCAYSS